MSYLLSKYKKKIRLKQHKMTSHIGKNISHIYTYLVVFWVILFFQVFFILILDKTFVKNIPKTATFWERFIHAIEKSQLPFPYSNWHESNGDCNDHVKKHKAAQIEVLITMAFNLFFNMVLIFND